MISTSIEQFIASKPNIDMTYEFLSYYEKIDDVAIISYNVLNDYIQEIKDISVILTLSDEDLINYKYSPKKLCRDIYGSAELFFILLALNDMASPKEFTKNKIKALYKSDMNKIVTYILNAERTAKSVNDEEMKK